MSGQTSSGFNFERVFVLENTSYTLEQVKHTFDKEGILIKEG